MTGADVIGPPWSVTRTGRIRYSLHDLQRFVGRQPEGEDRLMGATEAAAYIGYHRVTLAKWRMANFDGKKGRAA